MAKRFRFRLEPLLKMRKGKEDVQKRVLAQRVAEVQRLVDQLAQLHHRVERTIDQARADRMAEHLCVADALQGQRWRLHLSRRITQQQACIHDAQGILNNDRMELARRSRDRKVIETLRERKWQEHVLAENRAERVESDEIGGQMYSRGRDGGTKGPRDIGTKVWNAHGLQPVGFGKFSDG